MNAQLVLLVGLATASLVACGNEAVESPSNDIVTQVTTDAQGTADTFIEPYFELGRNVTGKNTPAFYEPVTEGEDLEVELGPQGLWMVVLAFKTRAMLTPPLFLTGIIDVLDHDTAGALKLQKQKVFPGGDGYDYYYNFWLVVKKDDGGFPFGVAGKTGVIKFEVSDVNGKTHSVERKVQLTGGPTP